MSYSYIFKYILIGDSGVGKSSLLKRFIDGNFRRDYDSTLGVEFGVKTISIKDKDIKLQLWDTAGQEVFKSITKSYYRGIAGIILVYDITRRQSFLNLKNWIADIKSVNPNNIPIIVIGNKCDLEIHRQIKCTELESFALENKYLFKEISVKNGTDITNIFYDLTEHILNKLEAREIIVKDENGIKENISLMDTNPPISLVQRSKNRIYNCCSI